MMMDTIVAPQPIDIVTCRSPDGCGCNVLVMADVMEADVARTISPPRPPTLFASAYISSCGGALHLHLSRRTYGIDRRFSETPRLWER